MRYGRHAKQPAVLSEGDTGVGGGELALVDVAAGEVLEEGTHSGLR